MHSGAKSLSTIQKQWGMRVTVLQHLRKHSGWAGVFKKQEILARKQLESYRLLLGNVMELVSGLPARKPSGLFGTWLKLRQSRTLWAICFTPISKLHSFTQRVNECASQW